jgi:hypothetical protein
VILNKIPFSEIWCCDFEYQAPDGERPTPLCMVAKEMRTGRLIRLWRDELLRLKSAPFDVGLDVVFTTFYASAELLCFLGLGWPTPERILDLCAEFRLATSGLPTACGHSLLGCLTHYGLDGIAAAEKEQMRALAMRGGSYTPEERTALLSYCQADVDALAKLLPVMPIDLPRALLRGRYMMAAARMEWTGVPIDADLLARLRASWPEIQDRLIAEVDADFHVFDGRSFRAERWAAWLAEHSIPWPRLPSGALSLDKDTFREMGRSYPAVATMGELRHALSDLRLNDLAVGSDGRNRCLLGAFGSRTGRNQPSNSRFIFGPATWLRGLIRPEAGRAIGYLDYEQQEFGIAAALSGDVAMQTAYNSSDPYLRFAAQAGAVPADATKTTHRAEREIFKIVVLAVQYCMGAETLARRLNLSPAHGRELLALHRRTYPRYWAWSDAVETYAMLHGELHTVFGWRVHTGPLVNPRSLRNFPLQAGGGEILRLACCLATESGIDVCAPVHDALLIEADEDQIDGVVEHCRELMEAASAVVLGGFRLRTDAQVIHNPDRYADPRGQKMWSVVNRLLGQIDTSRSLAGGVPATLRPLPNLLFLSLKESNSLNGSLTHDQGHLQRSHQTQVHTSQDDTSLNPTPETSIGREVPERADPDALVGGSGTTSRAVEIAGADRPVAVALGGMYPETDGQVLSSEGANDGDEHGHGESSDSCSGESWFGDCGPLAGPLPGCDDQRSPSVIPPELGTLLNEITDQERRDDLLYRYQERAGIYEFEGGLSRPEAERLALDDLKQQSEVAPCPTS